MNILLNGISGFMGREVKKLCESEYKGACLSIGVDLMAEGNEAPAVYRSFTSVEDTGAIDCIIDFSHHTATPALLEFASERGLPVVLATTGHTDEEIAMIHSASKSIPIFYSGNMSLGIALLIELAKTSATAFPDANIEIIEKHHIRKVDAPSGTALMLAEAIREVRPELYANAGRSGSGKRSDEEIGIHSIRMGNIVGEHEVIIGTPSQTITLRHEAHNRALFAEGAITAAVYLIGQLPGMYDMKSMLSNERTSYAVITAD